MCEYDLAEGRGYRHRKCGQLTLITDSDYAFLCNPFDPCLGTMCVHCGSAFGLGAFDWADTEESLSSYRRRLRRQSPAWMSIWSYLSSPMIGAAIGALIAWSQNQESGVVALAAAGGALVMCVFIGPKILALMTGNSFYKNP